MIPLLWLAQTFISWLGAVLLSWLFRLRSPRPRNFLVAMSVFGNSNSLPISLILSLAHTVSGLHWLPGDTDGDVAARGILYLLIYQQLGQAVRWSWGYHVLLKPKSEYPEYRADAAEQGAAAQQQQQSYRDSVVCSGGNGNSQESSDETCGGDISGDARSEDGVNGDDDLDNYSPAGRTPVVGSSSHSPADSDDDEAGGGVGPHSKHRGLKDDDGCIRFPQVASKLRAAPDHHIGVFKAKWARKVGSAKNSGRTMRHKVYSSLPRPARKILDFLAVCVAKIRVFISKFMNPPLWAMLLALIVASVPQLQKLFFGRGFVNNSITTSVESLGAVAVPMILVVLGGNLAMGTEEVSLDAEEKEIGKRLIAASLVGRMVLPPLIMGPFFAVFVKFVPVSILADPIFVIVTFLLMGAPTALQLAQICQKNEAYEGVMAKLMFHGYVTT